MRNKIPSCLIENNTKAFTLIELIVSISIFLIIIVAVTNIFISSNDISSKADVNRVMQENIKNIIENISEDIRKYGIKGVSSIKPDTACATSGTIVGKYKIGNKMCTGNSSYYLAKKNSSGIYIRVDTSENISKCGNPGDVCTLLKDGEPLSNSFVTFKELFFKVSEGPIKKLTINFIMQPSPYKGVKPSLIKNSKIIFQTTITEKLIKTN